MARQPAVAGQFYPGTPDELREDVSRRLAGLPAPQPALLAISPHAGYMYSGDTAAKTLGRVVIPGRVAVVGPNHRGLGAPAAVMTAGRWLTPLGALELDAELGADLMSRCDLVQEDSRAHELEHSLEVQIPFLQHLRPDFRLTPLCLGALGFEHCRRIGLALAGAVRAAGEPVLLTASTDMTHYESARAAEEKDRQALERILALDPRGLYDTVRGLGVTMCGVLPVVVCLTAALELGATRAELVEYTNSGAATGDYSQVVGYAGLIVR